MPLSYVNNIVMRNMDFKCSRRFFAVEKSNQYKMSDFTFENLTIKEFNTNIIDSFTVRNVNINKDLK